MTTVSYPGVYIEEVAGGARPIQLAGTSTAALVGITERGPVGIAVRVSSWDKYRRVFGGFVANSYLAESAFALFNNGGRQCDVVRIARSDAASATVTLNNRAATPVGGVRFAARNLGAWGNQLLLTVEDSSVDPGNGFKLTVRQQAETSTVPLDLGELPVLEVHDNLGMDPLATNHFVDVLDRDSELLRAMSASTNTALQAGFCLGETQAQVPKPAASSNRFKISIDGDAFQTVTLANGTGANYDWAALAADIEAKVSALVPRKTSIPDLAYLGFTCTVVAGTNGAAQLRLKSGTNDHARSAVLLQNAPENNIAERLGLSAGNKVRVEGALALRRPALVASVQLGDASANDIGVAETPTLGTDGTQPVVELDYFTAFSALDRRTDVSLLLAPGVGTPQMMDLGSSYCQNRPIQDMFYLGEVGSNDVEPSHALDFQARLTKRNSYGALYFPWLLGSDPSGRSALPVRLPPSGHIAGLYARIDSSRGVWKAPAGTEASLSGVVGLAGEVTDVQQGTLNPLGVNVIRRISRAGVVSWGARTVSADPEYMYVPVRRLAIMLRRSIYDGIQWAVFEPNDSRLWSSLRLNISSLMNNLFRAGAFQGDKVADAYFVRCGLGDTMTQGDIDRGQVIVLVGFAPVKPTEFVIVRIQQKAGQQ